VHHPHSAPCPPFQGVSPLGHAPLNLCSPAPLSAGGNRPTLQALFFFSSSPSFSAFVSRAPARDKNNLPSLFLSAITVIFPCHPISLFPSSTVCEDFHRSPPFSIHPPLQRGLVFRCAGAFSAAPELRSSPSPSLIRAPFVTLPPDDRHHSLSNVFFSWLSRDLCRLFRVRHRLFPTF